MSNDFKFDKDFLKQLEMYIEDKTNVNSITERIERAIGKSILTSSLEIILNDLGIPTSKVDWFSESIIDRCKKYDISVTTGLMFFIESLNDFAEMTKGDNDDK